MSSDAPQPQRITNVPVNIFNYTIRELTVRPHPGYRDDADLSAQVQTTGSVSRSNENKQLFQVTLLARFFSGNPDENLPYDVTIAIDGEFVSFVNIPSDAIPARWFHTALAMIYGIARGVVGQTTAAGLNGKFVLPAVLLNDLVSTATNDPNSGVISDATFQQYLEEQKQLAKAAVSSPKQP